MNGKEGIPRGFVVVVVVSILLLFSWSLFLARVFCVLFLFLCLYLVPLSSFFFVLFFSQTVSSKYEVAYRFSNVCVDEYLVALQWYLVRLVRNRATNQNKIRGCLIDLQNEEAFRIRGERLKPGSLSLGECVARYLPGKGRKCSPAAPTE